MAGLNEKVVLAAVGELECVDGKPIEIPEEERIGEAVLISTQLARIGRRVGETLLGERSNT
jgi:hypothetical protein